jgi:hypothetical protein
MTWIPVAIVLCLLGCLAVGLCMMAANGNDVETRGREQ